MSTFGKRLKIIMKDKGLKQVDLASKTKISKSMINEYLNDKYLPKQKNMLLISEALNVPLWELTDDFFDKLDFLGRQGLVYYEEITNANLRYNPTHFAIWPFTKLREKSLNGTLFGYLNDEIMYLFDTSECTKDQDFVISLNSDNKVEILKFDKAKVKKNQIIGKIMMCYSKHPINYGD